MSKEDKFNEVDEFIIKANDKIISSKLLFEGGQYATSVSAAYYAMFLTVKALLIKKTIILKLIVV